MVGKAYLSKKSKVIKSKDSLYKGISGFKDTLNKGFLDFRSPKDFLNSVMLNAHIRYSRTIKVYPSFMHSVLLRCTGHPEFFRIIYAYQKAIYRARDNLINVEHFCRHHHINPVNLIERLDSGEFDIIESDAWYIYNRLKDLCFSINELTG